VPLGYAAFGPCASPRAAALNSSGCDRAGTSRGGVPSLFAWDRASDTPPRDARSGPAACGGIAAPPEGRRFAPTPTPTRNNPDIVTPHQSALPARVLSQRMGVFHAGAMGGRSLRSPRVPDARAISGRRRRGCLRTPRGPDADRARPVAGAGACRRPPWHRQKKNSRHAMTREREPPTRGARRKASTDWEKHRALHPWRTKKRSDTVEEKKSLQGREASRRRSEPEARRNAGLGGEGSERLRDQHRGPLPPRLLAISAVGVMRR
jgi:hypothetical protein